MAALGADAPPGAESSLAAAGDLVLRTSYGAVSSATTATCAEEAPGAGCFGAPPKGVHPKRGMARLDDGS